MLAPTKLIASVLMFSLFAGSLNGPFRTVAKNYAGSLANGRINQDDDSGKGENGLQFHLSPGIEQPDQRPSPKLAPVTELSQSETETILNRLPSAKIEANVESGFNLRERSLPPPRTGQTINISFPPPTTAAAPDTTAAGPLEIVRFAPEG